MNLTMWTAAVVCILISPAVGLGNSSNCEEIWEQEGEFYVLAILEICMINYPYISLHDAVLAQLIRFAYRKDDNTHHLGYYIISCCETPPDCVFKILGRIWSAHLADTKRIVTLIASFSLENDDAVVFLKAYLPTVFVDVHGVTIYRHASEDDGEGAVETLLTLFQHSDWNLVGVIQNNEKQIAHIADNFTQRDKAEICIEFLEKGSLNTADLYHRIVTAEGNLTVIFDYNGYLLQKSLVKSVATKQVIVCCFWTRVPSGQMALTSNYDGIMSLHKKPRSTPEFLEFLESILVGPGNTSSEYLLRRACFVCEASAPWTEQICSNSFGLLEINPLLQEGNCSHNLSNACAPCLRALAGQDVVFQLFSFLKKLSMAIEDFCTETNNSCDQMGNSETFKSMFERFFIQNFFPASPPNLNVFDVMYWTLKEGDSLELHKVNITNGHHVTGTNEIASSCRRSCPPGHFRKPDDSLPLNCCYQCTACEAGSFSNGSAVEKCWRCPNTEWSYRASDSCWLKSNMYLFWLDPISILMMIFTVLGMVLTLFVLAVYLKYDDTPIVKTTGGFTFHCYVLGSFCSFASIFFIIGEPKDWKCMLRRPVFGISFALCLSSVLAKTIRILCAFSSPVVRPTKIQTRLYLVIILAGPLIQCVICALWMVLDPPKVIVVFPEDETYVVLDCSGDSVVFPFLVQGYLCSLAFCTLAFAMKSQSLPSNFNDAQGISYAMMVFFVTWLSVIPVLQAGKGKLVNQVFVIVVLLSAFSSLTFLFLHKCYIILFRPECNTPEWIKKSTYEYCQKIAQKANLSIHGQTPL